eukprot:TRINITY_DN3998_c0_g1_i4.p1 TRINITY_DN3998_c0_g1~~TRINITY_DN3998_c0_g1_i4.p1  ORF type:complete len:368 (-),score=82.46 TRINITY_DN3998_c0_g1_i4:57-1160(-)
MSSLSASRLTAAVSPYRDVEKYSHPTFQVPSPRRFLSLKSNAPLRYHLQYFATIFPVQRTTGGIQSLHAKKSTEQELVGFKSQGTHPDEDEMVEEVEEETEGDKTWLKESSELLVGKVTSVMQVVPGPRVGKSSLPWLVAVPAAILFLTFVQSVVKVIRMRNSPRANRRRQVGKNAYLCQSLASFLPERRAELDMSQLRKLERQCGFTTLEVFRKFIRYVLNERPFDPVLVADVIHLRRTSRLTDDEVVNVLNEIARRIVKEKGPVVMDTSGFTEKGIKRKAAVQALCSKLLYLAELEDICAAEAQQKLQLKSIFGITDEDASAIRIESLSDATAMAALDASLNLEESDGEAAGEEGEDGLGIEDQN